MNLEFTTLKKEYLFLLIILLNSINLQAQNQNNKWNFGNKASVDFNSGSPISTSNSELVSVEGVASIADRNTGNILFYSDGLNIWNANNQVMPNGTGLLGASQTSSTQGVLIAEYPNSPNKYFVFTVDETSNGGNNGFRYSIVDMTLDNGLGDIITNQKNILIQTNTTERLAIAKKADGKGFWIIIHERGNNIFKAYELNTNGLNLNPVISITGQSHLTNAGSFGDPTMGCLKINNSFNKLAVAIYSINKIQLFDFNNCTGEISNPISILTLDNPYGIEFSPDDSKLYYTLYYNAGFNGAVYQVDLLAPNISSSSTLVGISSSENFSCIGALQLAPDNKIYISINGEPWLSAISQPNNLGASCGFVDQAVTLVQSGLSPTTCLFGLPQRVLLLDSLNFTPDSIQAENLCASNSTSFSVSLTNDLSQVIWDFGDSTNQQTTINTSTIEHTFKNQGTYLVTAIITTECTIDTLVKSITINDCTLPICDPKTANVFSPNNDGINDIFVLTNNCQFDEYSISIFNRWGIEVFSSNDSTIPWDGKFIGEECPDGVYFMLLNYTLGTSKKNINQAISLIR